MNRNIHKNGKSLINAYIENCQTPHSFYHSIDNTSYIYELIGYLSIIPLVFTCQRPPMGTSANTCSTELLFPFRYDDITFLP